jgi:hypothetical protein
MTSVRSPCSSSTSSPSYVEQKTVTSCSSPGSGMHRATVFRPPLDHDELRVCSHLIMDLPTADALVPGRHSADC